MASDLEENRYLGPGPAKAPLGTMTKPCNLCHKHVLVVQAFHDCEWGWCHKSCVNGISTKGS